MTSSRSKSRPSTKEVWLCRRETPSVRNSIIHPVNAPQSKPTLVTNQNQHTVILLSLFSLPWTTNFTRANSNYKILRICVLRIQSCIYSILYNIVVLGHLYSTRNTTCTKQLHIELVLHNIEIDYLTKLVLSSIFMLENSPSSSSDNFFLCSLVGRSTFQVKLK